MDPLAAIGCQDDADIRIDLAALDLAAADRALVDTAVPAAWLDQLARRLPAQPQGAAARADALSALLADDEGFQGDDLDYDNPRNADFLDVLDRRRGLPIALAILYVGQARRAGWPAQVLGLPGHVLVAVGSEADRVLLDPFRSGRRVSPEAFSDLVANALGRGQSLRRDQAQFLDNRSILVRLVMNQASRARQAGDSARALTLYRRLTLVAPTLAALWWERARLEQISGDINAARRSLAAMRETTRDPALHDRIRAAFAALTR